jgi:hypothetical protein
MSEHTYNFNATFENAEPGRPVRQDARALGLAHVLRRRNRIEQKIALDCLYHLLFREATRKIYWAQHHMKIVVAFPVRAEAGEILNVCFYLYMCSLNFIYVL